MGLIRRKEIFQQLTFRRTTAAMMIIMAIMSVRDCGRGYCSELLLQASAYGSYGDHGRGYHAGHDDGETLTYPEQRLQPDI